MTLSDRLYRTFFNSTTKPLARGPDVLNRLKMAFLASEENQQDGNVGRGNATDS
jgi:hypothetical protein